MARQRAERRQTPRPLPRPASDRPQLADERALGRADCDPYGVAKKHHSARADRIDEWAVSVRLNDGRVLFWCGEESERRGQDWGRESQAFRFTSRDEAERFAAGCATNSNAWEYR